MEDQLASVDMKVIKKCNKNFKNLLGVGYPYPQVLDTSKTLTNMQRKAMVIGIKPECIEDYKKNHANTWPEVLETISKGNVKNFSIFIHGTLL